MRELRVILPDGLVVYHISGLSAYSFKNFYKTVLRDKQQCCVPYGSCRLPKIPVQMPAVIVDHMALFDRLSYPDKFLR